MHLTAVGRDRAFRLLVTFVSVGLQVGLVFAADKIHFGHRLTELGFIEDVKLMQITIPQGNEGGTISSLSSSILPGFIAAVGSCL